MPLIRQAHFRTALQFSLMAYLSLVVLLWPDRAEANVSCQINGQPSLEFGSSSLGQAVINYTCRADQNNQTSLSFTICTSIAAQTSTQYGTMAQPQMVGPTNADRLAFNLYTDPSGTVPFTQDNFVTAPLTLAPGQTATGSLRYYGRIPSGQSVRTGNYAGTINTIVFGVVPSAGQYRCQQNFTNFNGQTYNLSVRAVVAASCNLGLIRAIDFGAPTDYSDPIDAAGSVQVTCPANTTWTLHFNAGLYASGAQRRMRSDDGDYLAYRLYRDNGRTSEIAINGTVTGTGIGSVQTTPVYGRVTVSRVPPEGEYADVVVVVLSF